MAAPLTSNNVNPCKEDVYSSLLSSNLTRPCIYTPDERDNVTTTANILSHETKTLYFPYSSVVNILVNMGVEIAEMALCKKVQTKNHKAALTGNANELYFSFKEPIISKIFFTNSTHPILKSLSLQT